LPVELTEVVDLGPTGVPLIDREEKVRKALTINPSLASVTQRLDVDDLSIQSARNGLLPNLSLNAGYTTYGRGGTFIASAPSSRSPLDPVVVVPGGLGDALYQMFGFGSPTYVAGLTLTLPIRSRVASATMANAVVQKRTDSLVVRNQQQN